MPLEHRPIHNMHPGNARSAFDGSRIMGGAWAQHMWRRGHPQRGVVGGAPDREHRAYPRVARQHEIAPLSRRFAGQHRPLAEAADHQLTGLLADGGAFHKNRGVYSGRYERRRDGRRRTGELLPELRVLMLIDPAPYKGVALQ
ncbi:hypothetical protein GEMMAAP_05565 [Gemmatimonas phototrophica]|uniref:Uncharacterized protein n=1 Tax=Gemmatimonas phototrophica TaxID=1379270 RepID=A0A143BIS6_9BACT|nr:hypothetical protein GEMMAAP_05565 [Gemmatimonas phototrophica]